MHARAVAGVHMTGSALRYAGESDPWVFVEAVLAPKGAEESVQSVVLRKGRLAKTVLAACERILFRSPQLPALASANGPIGPWAAPRTHQERASL